MKFVIDAQLPRRLCGLLAEYDHDACYTLDLPRQNRTPDDELTSLADRERRVLVTKDDDFVSSHVREKRPNKLLLISTGNIANDDLLSLVRANLDVIVESFETRSFLELSRTYLIVHD
ncbi:MAG: DUF5615 family PIN-like protein [Fimbriimonadales bacterium]